MNITGKLAILASCAVSIFTIALLINLIFY